MSVLVGCGWSFSWVVFGVVVGCSALVTVTVLVLLHVWNKRARERANAQLAKRELKYRAIERLL
jgi:hypothetical protein